MKTPRRKVQVWIYRKKDDAIEVLLFKTNPKRGSFWQPVTGSVEEGEALEAAARREATEESGLRFLEPLLSLDRSFRFESSYDGGPMIQFEEWGYALEAVAGDQVRIDPHEHIEFDWTTPGKAKQRIRFPSNREMLQALMAKLSITE